MAASIHENTTIAPTLRTLPRRNAAITELDKVRSDRLASAQQRRAAARTRDLTALLRGRPDLAGVHSPADFAVDAALWCV